MTARSKNPRGRPPLDPSRRRSVVLKIYLTPTEHDRLVKHAAVTNLGPSAYARKAALGQPLPRSVPKINRDVFRILAGIGGNLNQLLHHLNSRAAPPLPAPLPDLHALLGLLLSIKRLLLR